MGRRTTGSLITRGKARNYYLRWQHDGKVRVMRLSDQDGKPITRCLEDEWAAEHLMALCREAAPSLFAHAGPSCVSEGKCSEGKMSCGKPRTELIMK